MIESDLSPITDERITQALHLLAQNTESLQIMFTDKDARKTLSTNTFPYLQGILQRFSEQDGDGDQPLNLDSDRLNIMANSLVQLGIAIGRHYEQTNHQPRIEKTISMSEAYSILQEGNE